MSSNCESSLVLNQSINLNLVDWNENKFGGPQTIVGDRILNEEELEGLKFYWTYEDDARRCYFVYLTL